MTAAAIQTEPAHLSVRDRRYRVLVCDDQPDVCHAIRLLLKGAGYQTEVVDSPRALLAAASSGSFDLILADLNYTADTTSGREGLEMVSRLRNQGDTTPLIVMTAWGNIELAVEAMRRGACDFIQKPWDNHRMLDAIREHAEAARARKTEIEAAASVQRKLLPPEPRNLATIEVAARCIAARGVAGDYYDFVEIGDRSVGFVAADVSGKGVPAALLMANLQACVRSRPCEDWRQPAKALESVNRHLYASTEAERFATLFFGIYDQPARTLRYVNCGHCPPILLRATGEVTELAPTATVLGAFPVWTGSVSEVALKPGDKLLLYSDGVTEASNPAGEEFGCEPLVRALRSSDSAHGVVEEVLRGVAAFSESSPKDDVTVVAIRVK